MKNIILTLGLFLAFTAFATAQEKKAYEIENAMVKATYFHDNGVIAQQGFYKDGKPYGEWTQYDREGNKIASAHYENGKKDGKWIFWNEGKLNEVDYRNNRVVSVNQWNSMEQIVANSK